MRNYELMVVFPLDEGVYNTGVEAVRSTLENFSVKTEKEEVFGDKDLAYEIKKQKRGRYILFNLLISPEKISDLSRQLKLNQNILTFLFVRVEN